jgi:hypothetical protein
LKLKKEDKMVWNSCFRLEMEDKVLVLDMNLKKKISFTIEIEEIEFFGEKNFDL